MKEDNSLLEAFLRQLASARVLILFLFHVVVFTAAFAFSYLLRFEFAIPPEQIQTFRSCLWMASSSAQ